MLQRVISPHAVCTSLRLTSRLQFQVCGAQPLCAESPKLNGLPHPSNELPQLGSDLGPTRTSILTQRSPVVPESLSLPKRDRSRLDKEQGSAPLRPQFRENGPEQPVRRRDAWPLPLHPIGGELMTQGGDFQLQ